MASRLPLAEDDVLELLAIRDGYDGERLPVEIEGAEREVGRGR